MSKSSYAVYKAIIRANSSFVNATANEIAHDASSFEVVDRLVINPLPSEDGWAFTEVKGTIDQVSLLVGQLSKFVVSIGRDEPVTALNVTEKQFDALIAELDVLRKIGARYEVIGYKNPDESPAYISDFHNTFAEAEQDAMGSGLIIEIRATRQLTKDEYTYGWLRNKKN